MVCGVFAKREKLCYRRQKETKKKVPSVVEHRYDTKVDEQLYPSYLLVFFFKNFFNSARGYYRFIICGRNFYFYFAK